MRKQAISTAIILSIILISMLYAFIATYYRSFVTKNFEVIQPEAEASE